MLFYILPERLRPGPNNSFSSLRSSNSNYSSSFRMKSTGNRNSRKICLLILLIFWVLAIMLTVMMFRQGPGHPKRMDYRDRENRLSSLRFMMKAYWKMLKLEPTPQSNDQEISFSPKYIQQDYICLLVESQDLLMLMLMKDGPFLEAQKWMNETDFTPDELVSVASTVRCTLGSLLSLYSTSGTWLSADVAQMDLYQSKAREVAEGLLPAFLSHTGVPYPIVNPHTKLVYFEMPPKLSYSFLEDFGGMHMELCYVSLITRDKRFCNLANSVRNYVLQNLRITNDSSNNQAANRFDPEHPGNAGGLCPISSCFHRHLLLSDPNQESAQALFRMLHGSPIGGQAAGLISFFAQLSRETDNKSYLELATQLLNIYETTFSAMYHIDKYGVVDAPALTEWQKTADLAEAYFFLHRVNGGSVDQLDRSEYLLRRLQLLIFQRQMMPEAPVFEEARLVLKAIRYLFLMYSDSRLLSLDHWTLNCDGHPIPKPMEILHIGQIPASSKFNYTAADILARLEKARQSSGNITNSNNKPELQSKLETKKIKPQLG